MTILKYAASLATAVCTLLTVHLAAKWSYADWLSNRPTVSERQRAAMLAPSDASLWLRDADLLSMDGKDTRPLLERAIRCSPSDGSIWTRKGLEEEAAGDYRHAEISLLRAAALNHDATSPWTLANFYFRRHNFADFAAAAKQTLALSQEDRIPVFQMARELDPDATDILNRAIPDSPGPLVAYLTWLTSVAPLDAAYSTAERLLRHFPREGAPALINYCDRLIAGNSLKQAASLWNALRAARVLNPGPVHQDRILNGNFRSPPRNGGFDWHLNSADGIEVNASPSGLRVTFSGNQADRFVIASQPLLLSTSAISVRYGVQCSGIEAGSGVRWLIVNSEKAVVTSQGDDFAGACNNTASWVVGPIKHGLSSEPKCFWLQLFYGRQPLTPQARGWIRIEEVSIEKRE